MTLRVVASIEARFQSSRLPGKVLADVNGVPALGRILRRLRCAQRLDAIVLATTTEAADDALAAFADTEQIPCYRGSNDDVLGRVVAAQQQLESNIVVEVCGDTPLIDPEIIDLAVDTFFANGCDVASTTYKLSFPQGMDAQVFRLSDLEQVARDVDDPAVREHVSLYFYEHPERYRIINIMAPIRWRAPSLRCQLDYPEDLRFINEVYAQLEPTYGDSFGVPEIIALIERAPQLAEINRHCQERQPR